MRRRKRIRTPLPERVASAPLKVFPDFSAMSRQTSAHLYDFAPVMFFLMDTAGLIVSANHACLSTLSLSRSRLLNAPLRSFVVEADRPLLFAHLRQSRESPRVIETDLLLRSRRGDTIPVRLYTQRVFHDGGLTFPTVAVDLSERLILERAREAAERQRDESDERRRQAMASDAAKDELIAVVSHELRNPLNPALLAADQLASSRELPDSARYLAGIIKRNIELEARLVDDLLDVARIARGQLELRLAATDVHESLAEAVANATRAALDRSIALTMDLAAPNHHALADAARLRQVFWNVLNNAVKFTDAGGAIAVRTRGVADCIVVSVSDNGVGMDETTLAGLFTPFASRGQRRGLGLGLSIASSIVQAFGGRILGRSDGPGRGSEFQIELAALTFPVASG